MKQNRNILLLILAIITTILSGCNKEKNIFLDYCHISSEGWNKETILTFEPYIEDKMPLDVMIELRHNNDYPYQNIWFFVSLFHKDQIIQTDTVQYILANDFGRWHGRGCNALYQLSLMYKQRVVFPDTGKYKIQIEQAMRDNPLYGVEDIGLRIALPTSSEK